MVIDDVHWQSLPYQFWQHTFPRTGSVVADRDQGNPWNATRKF